VKAIDFRSGDRLNLTRYRSSEGSTPLSVSFHPSGSCSFEFVQTPRLTSSISFTLAENSSPSLRKCSTAVSSNTELANRWHRRARVAKIRSVHRLPRCSCASVSISLSRQRAESALYSNLDCVMASSRHAGQGTIPSQILTRSHLQQSLVHGEPIVVPAMSSRTER
jgi:hypothetical protein